MVDGTHGVLPLGHRFHGRYEILRCLEAGGIGAVYEVVDHKTQRRRALKVMLPASIQDADLRARFGLEATITAGVESDHIVETFDADVDADTGSPFIVMELLKGEDLGAVLGQRDRLPPSEVLPLLAQLALALDKTHARRRRRLEDGKDRVAPRSMLGFFHESASVLLDRLRAERDNTGKPTATNGRRRAT